MIDFYNFCTVVSRKNCFTHIWQKCPPHLNNVLTLPSENENITFHTFIMHSWILHAASSMVWNKVNQVQRKQIDSHKVCSKCPPPARTQARKRVCHWSTASSISDCSKRRQTLSQLIDVMNSGLIHVGEWQTMAPDMRLPNSPDLNPVDYAIWFVIQLNTAGGSVAYW